MLHIAPVAAALAGQDACAVRLYVASRQDSLHLARVLQTLDAQLPIDELPTPAWLRGLARVAPRLAALKGLRLLSGRQHLQDLDVLVTAERTSTILKRLPGWKPALVHIPHGAGDRARGFERRLRLFDHIIVAGPKDRDRMVADGLVSGERCSVSGYVKLAAVLRMRGQRPAAHLFGNDKPIVLYNPHFTPGLSSWPAFRDALSRATREMTDHNFVIAPHVRFAEKLSPADRRRLTDLEAPGRVIVDLGSERSIDMTYTMAADIYLGDVSSQVYEYLHTPKPCVFLNATGQGRSGNSNFVFWEFGEVIDDPMDVADTIRRARARHPDFSERQIAGVKRAFGTTDGCAVARAAAIVGELASARHFERRPPGHV